MGAKLCTLCHPTSDQISKSPGARDGKPCAGTGSSFKEFIKPRCMKIENRRAYKGKQTKNLKRKTQTEAPDEKKIPKARKLTLEDWLLASPGSKPDYLRKGELCALKQSKKKVHPCSSQFRGSLIGEAKDSLSLGRPMNRQEGDEGMSKCSSITRSLSGKSQKRVSFKLPPIVILYSPDEPYCNAASLCSPEEPYSSEDALYSPDGPNCKGNSLDSPEEACFRLAVNTLPHVAVNTLPQVVISSSI